MFTVQNAWSWDVFGCPRNEAWFWAVVNNAVGGFQYNVYGPSTTYTLSPMEIARYV